MAAATREASTRHPETQDVARSRQFIELLFTLHLALKRGDNKQNVATK